MRSDGTWSPEEATRFLAAGSLSSGLFHGAVVFDVEVGLHIERRGDSEVVVEAVVARSGCEPLSVVGLFGTAQSKMPLANTGGVVAALAEHGGGGETGLVNQVRPKFPKHSPLPARTPAGTATGDGAGAG